VEAGNIPIDLRTIERDDVTDKCQANGCGAPVEEGGFMCATHWRMVPAALKRTVRRSFQERGGDNGNPLYLPYLDACAQAVELIAMHENLPAENAFRRAANLLEEYMAQSSQSG
jgi:hypothetical protein